MNQARNTESEHEWPDDIEVSDRGRDERDRCHNEFSDLLRNEAIMNMRRRQSQSLDESDYKAANAHLLSGHKKDWIREIVGSTGAAIGTLPIAFGISFLTANPNRIENWISWSLVVLGLLFTGICLFFQHFRPRR